MKLRLEIWRQAGAAETGHFEHHEVDGVSPRQTLLEALDLLNRRLVREGRSPIAFESATSTCTFRASFGT